MTQSINDLICPFSQHANLPLIKQGWLMKQGGFIKNYQKRWFEIRGNMAFYYTDGSKKDRKGDFSLVHTSIGPDSSIGKQFCIKVTPEEKGRVFYLIASSNEDQEEWINALMRSSVWEPGLETSRPVTLSNAVLNANIRGMLDSEECREHVKSILINLKALDTGMTLAELNTTNDTICIEGSFNQQRVISILEDAGYLIYLTSK
jgi:hypothetical protein